MAVAYAVDIGRGLSGEFTRGGGCVFVGMAEKSDRASNPDRSCLLPPSLLEWLPEGHLAYLVLEIVRELDLSGIEEEIRRKDRLGGAAVFAGDDGGADALRR